MHNLCISTGLNSHYKGATFTLTLRGGANLSGLLYIPNLSLFKNPMLKNNDLLLLGIVGVIGWSFYSKARAAGTLIFMPAGVSQISFDGGSPLIVFNLIVQNTSSSGFVLESLAGNVYCDSTYIGNVSSFNPIQVPGNSQVTIPVNGRLMLVGIVNQITQAFLHKNVTKKIQLRGFANAGFIRAPVNVEFSIGL